MNESNTAGPLVISFVARSGTGKTTFLERLIPELRARELRVGIMKHHAHATPFDTPGKDTYRMTEAGASRVVGVCSTQTAIFIPENASEDLEGVIERYLGDMDVVLTEGYKRGHYPKIELYRARRAAEKGEAGQLLCAPEELLALVTDTSFPVAAPQFGLDDAAAVADFIAARVSAG